jgi:hypothetical protein
MRVIATHQLATISRCLDKPISGEIPIQADKLLKDSWLKEPFVMDHDKIEHILRATVGIRTISVKEMDDVRGALKDAQIATNAKTVLNELCNIVRDFVNKNMTHTVDRLSNDDDVTKRLAFKVINEISNKACAASTRFSHKTANEPTNKGKGQKGDKGKKGSKGGPYGKGFGKGFDKGFPKGQHFYPQQFYQQQFYPQQYQHSQQQQQVYQQPPQQQQYVGQNEGAAGQDQTTPKKATKGGKNLTPQG